MLKPTWQNYPCGRGSRGFLGSKGRRETATRENPAVITIRCPPPLPGFSGRNPGKEKGYGSKSEEGSQEEQLEKDLERVKNSGRRRCRRPRHRSSASRLIPPLSSRTRKNYSSMLRFIFPFVSIIPPNLYLFYGEPSIDNFCPYHSIGATDKSIPYLHTKPYTLSYIQILSIHI
jgi:hypothetical protein